MVDLSTDGSAEPWHLDRKVPIAIIVSLMTAVGGGIWTASAAMHRLSTLEKSDALTQVRIDAASNEAHIAGQRLSAIEQLSRDNQDMLRRVLDEILKRR